MPLHVLQMNDDTAELARWLESHLLGDSLGEVIGELSAAHPPDDDRSQSLGDVLGEQLDACLQQGLGTLSEERLRSLIRYPWLLRDLQEQVLLQGSDYWRKRPLAASVADAERRIRDRLRSHLDSTDVPSSGSPTSETKPQPLGAAVKQSRRSFLPATTLAAAVLLLALGIRFALTPSNPESKAWGWNRAGVFSQELSAREYLLRMADAAKEWSSETPDSPKSLRKRLLELRSGCEKLLAADHGPLRRHAPEDEEWLKEKCRLWMKKIDGHLSALDEAPDFATVRKAADDTVATLVKTLQGKADEV